MKNVENDDKLLQLWESDLRADLEEFDGALRKLIAEVEKVIYDENARVRGPEGHRHRTPGLR